jgi:hypothetical protein
VDPAWAAHSQDEAFVRPLSRLVLPVRASDDLSRTPQAWDEPIQDRIQGNPSAETKREIGYESVTLRPRLNSSHEGGIRWYVDQYLGGIPGLRTSAETKQLLVVR